MEMQDKTVPCDTCGGSFVWTAGEQEFFEVKGFTAPKRCSGARKERKAQGQGVPSRYETCPFDGARGPTPVQHRPGAPRPTTSQPFSGGRTTGQVVRIVEYRGFGFIRDDAHQDYYFSERDLPAGVFGRLRVGSSVAFVSVESSRGLRAENVETAY